MRYVIALGLVVACVLVLLWHEVRAPMSSVTGSHAPAERSTADRGSLAASRPFAPAGTSRETTQVAEPPGGERTWTLAPAPAGGPDPFAPVPQIRTAEDTRAGLSD